MTHVREKCTLGLVSRVRRPGGLASFFFGELAVVNVGGRANPVLDLPVGVVHGHGATDVPAVFAIQRPPHPVLDFKEDPCRQRLHPEVDGLLPIVGVDDAQPPVVEKLLPGATVVVDGALVDVVDDSVGPGGPDLLRHGFGYLPVAEWRALLGHGFQNPIRRRARYGFE